MQISLLIDKIKHDKGLDLSGYKETTLRRRIERRMQFDRAGSLEEYIRMIDRDYRLYWRLISDFFIGVTDFFRDKEIWDVVRGKVLTEIIARCSSFVNRESSNESRTTNHESRFTNHEPRINLPIRVWSAGCSTGEETYSLAIAIKETLRKMNRESRSTNHEPPVFIYGTDIMEDKLEIAKEGIYSEEKLNNVDSNIRFNYFERIADGAGNDGINSEHIEIEKLSAKRYTLNANTKRIVSFRKYDLAKPETLAGFDMIVCRNVLIYFQRSLQEKIIRYFHKALRPEGILWLGKSETLWGESEKLFSSIFKQERIFKKI